MIYTIFILVVVTIVILFLFLLLFVVVSVLYLHGSRCQPRPFKELLARAAVTWWMTVPGRQQKWEVSVNQKEDGS